MYLRISIGNTRLLFVADSEYRKRIEPLTHLTKRDIRRSDNSMDLYYGSWVRDPSSRPDIGMSGKNTVYHINVKSNMIERASTSRTLLALNCTVFVLLGGSMLNGARITQFNRGQHSRGGQMRTREQNQRMQTLLSTLESRPDSLGPTHTHKERVGAILRLHWRLCKEHLNDRHERERHGAGSPIGRGK